jgi:membrane-bound lytic murein transglycosylase B
MMTLLESTQAPPGQPLAALLVSVVLTWMAGCATSGPVVRPSTAQQGATPSHEPENGGGFGFWEKGDDFQRLQQAAGLEEDTWHEAGEELESDDAQALWEALERTRTTLQNFGPRRSL